MEGALRRVATGLDRIELDGGDGGGIDPLIAGAAALDTDADFSLRDRGMVECDVKIDYQRRCSQRVGSEHVLNSEVARVSWQAQPGCFGQVRDNVIAGAIDRSNQAPSACSLSISKDQTQPPDSRETISAQSLQHEESCLVTNDKGHSHNNLTVMHLIHFDPY